MITCAGCGYHNEDEAVFCQRCDHYLAWSRSAEGDLAVAGSRGPRSAPLPGDEEASTIREPEASVPPIDSEEPEKASPVETAMAVLGEGRRLAAEQDRPDLARRLDHAGLRLAGSSIPIVVVGEFKRGKSTLINALLQTAICPVDADVVTAVPVMVKWGSEPSATTRTEARGEESDPHLESIALAALDDVVSESGNAQNRRGISMVEVTLPHAMLRSGLCLVDTPGVGGLDSAYGVVTLGTIDAAKGVLFVTDASQELTKPEIDFLRAVLDKGAAHVVVVMTKIDIHAEWRRILTLDEAHLEDAGIAVPVFAVSSFLRLREQRDTELEAESGFGALVDFLQREVVTDGATDAAKAAAEDAAFVAHQLGRQLEAEQAVLIEPEKAAEVVSTLTAARERTARLTSPAATWQQTLADGIADLIADVEHDLQQRLRGILIDVEAVIEEGDPRDTWVNITPWLQRQVVTAAIENRQTLERRTEELVRDVGERFDIEADFDRGPVVVRRPEDSVERVAVSGGESFRLPGGQLAPIVVAGRTAILVPLTVFGLAGVFSAVSSALFVLGPLGIVLGAGIGQRLISNERKRQVTYRQQQAVGAARRYVDDASFVIGKEIRDALRLTQRQLRDGFQQQALQIHRSSVKALAAAEGAQSAPAERTVQVRAGTRAVQRLSDAASRLASRPVVAVARG